MIKKLVPYLVTVVLFCILFALTQKIDTQIWYLGLEADSGAIVYNHKTSIQRKIFVWGLTLWLSLLSFLPTVQTNLPKLRSKISASALSVTVIYAINYGLSKTIDSGGFNIYYDWRHNLGIPLAIVTITISTGLIWVIQYILDVLEYLRQ